MREIKFRAWVTEYSDSESTGYMLDLPANRLKFDCEDGFVLAFGEPGFWACECYENRKPKFKVMQFTGLRDKNGKEIYEGDIVKITCPRDGDMVGHIIFDAAKGRFAWEENSDEPAYGLESDDPHNEIIGNIYENPELLEVAP